VLLPAVFAGTFAFSDGAPPAFRSIGLSSEPLYASTSGDKPTLTLALSVEYPTVGAQYTAAPKQNTDASYSNLTEYLGYYDAESCYTYNNAPTETPPSGQTAADLKRFDRVGAATDRMCSATYPNAFSGNFLNWATSSAIDMLRLALSGGDRSVDTESLTLLQRAYLPNGDPICMWNSTNFPAKQLTRGGGTSGQAFWGAVPAVMMESAGSSDIWVANTLNRIYFGTSMTGSCTSTSGYKLGAPVASTGVGPIQYKERNLPNNIQDCGAEGGYCTFSGIKEVWYGANGKWNVAPASNGVACTNAVFGDPISGTAKRCYYKTYNGDWTPPTSDSVLNSEGYFFSRVQVCQKDADGNLVDRRDYNLCTKYPSGYYKPVGVIQKYSDQLRLSAFGYLLDQTASYEGGRFGGVLRAPMKYVGTKTFNTSGQENTPANGNSGAEWDGTTGVFKTNPDNNAMGISGVVNYLNKFGRTGTAGMYKKYDPVSELYYQSLRYLQGLQPSPLAIQNMTDAMKDGFPVFTNWTDPFGEGRSNTGQYACLKNNIVVIGDINTHDDISRFPAADAANNIPNLSTWTSTVQKFEKGQTGTYIDGAGNSRTISNPSTINGSPRGDAIIGYSYWAHTHDIRGTGWTNNVAAQRPGLRVKTFIFDVNEYGDQNNANTRRFNNQFFTAAKYGGFEADPSNMGAHPYNTWGNPFRREDGTADDNVWQNDSNPGEAGTYYLQSSARGVLNAFNDIFSRASSSARSIAGSAVASQKYSDNNRIFQGSFDTADWSGDLQAFALSETDGDLSVATEKLWSASDQLAARTAERNIVVGNAGATAAVTATDFVWGSISADLKAALNKPSVGAAEDGLGEQRLAYIRGSSADEGSTFRPRNNKYLGDIVNSGVAFSGAPTSAIVDPTYGGFVADHLTRTHAVFVGANDGMLHAFNALDGTELFAYIPSWLGPQLSSLTTTDYVSNHKSYVDSTATVGEAKVGSAGTKDDWKTVLVSGTGGGGRGVFALDVTDPTAFSASSAMWEFTNQDDADLGFVVGKPQILKMRVSGASATPVYKWFAAFASGVNNYVTDANGVFSTTGKPALFILDLAKASSTPWTLGTNYFKVTLPVDEALAASVAPGFLNFTATAGTQREVVDIYGGDLHGNMWKLDFRPWGSADWTMEKLSAYKRGNTPYPLFVAKDSTGNVQPISMAPSIVQALRPAATYVAFGTGKYLESDDRTSTSRNSFYVLYDDGTATPDSDATLATSIISGRGRLQAGSINTTTKAISVPAFAWGRPTSDSATLTRSGWYIDYLGSGERQVSGALLNGDTLIFGSLIPGSTGSSICGVTGGSGNDYRINVDTGNGNYRVSTVGIMGQPLLVDLSETTETVSNSVGRRTRTITSQVVKQGSGGIATNPNDDKNIKTIIAGRLSWRQINNYQDLKNAP